MSKTAQSSSERKFMRICPVYSWSDIACFQMTYSRRSTNDCRTNEFEPLLSIQWRITKFSSPEDSAIIFEAAREKRTYATNQKCRNNGRHSAKGIQIATSTLLEYEWIWLVLSNDSKQILSITFWRSTVSQRNRKWKAEGAYADCNFLLCGMVVLYF